MSQQGSNGVLHVYKASAGSGKTYALVTEYLHLALKYPMAFQTILGVTFTNKAANEMKQRIISYIRLLIDSSRHDDEFRQSLINDLVAKTGISADLIPLKAEEVFKAILHHYSDFAISTIDSFVYGLVRLFTRELQLPSQFEVELETNYIAELIHHQLITRIGSDEVITNALLDWVYSKLDEEGSWRIKAEIISFIHELLKENPFLAAQDVKPLDTADIREIQSVLRKKISDDKTKLQQIATHIISLIEQAGLNILELTGKSTGIGKAFEELKEGDVKGAFDRQSLIRLLTLNAPLLPKSASAMDIHALTSIKHELDPWIKQLTTYYNEELKSFYFYSFLLPQLSVVRLGESLRAVIDNLITEEQIVHISEFNKRISELVNQAAVPYIYERLGERYNHYLIDEFQDTSVLQWRNFLPLLDNSLSQKHISFIVGDGKQAIYRFRGGEVEQFVSLPDIYTTQDHVISHQLQETFRREYNPVPLKTNYRSAREIVEFNNSFFKYIQQQLPPSLQSVYDDHYQDVRKDAPTGLVQLEFFDAKEPQEQDDSIADRVFELVQEMRQEGFAWKDIAVLARVKDETGQIAQHLTNKGVPVVSADSLLLSSSARVRFIMRLLRFYIFPNDAVNRIELIELYVNQIKPGNLTQNFQEILLSHTALPENQKAANTAQLIGYEITDLTGLSCYEAVCRLISHFQLDQPFDPYLNFLLEEIFRFEQGSAGSIADFLVYWDERLTKSSVVLSEKTDAVHVMTIHKAKGLEFPIVIYPYVSVPAGGRRIHYEWVDFGSHVIGKLKSGLLRITKALEKTDFGALYSKEQEKQKLDLANLLYVVMTRPSLRLYALIRQPRRKPAFSFHGLFQAYLKDQELWEDGQKVYSFGRKLEKLSAQEDPLHHSLLSEKYFTRFQPAWSTRTAVKAVDLSFLEYSEKDPKMKGVLYHNFLAGLKSVHQLDSAIRQYERLGLFSAEEAEVMRNFFSQLASYPIVYACFDADNTSSSEASLLAENGDLLRVDRISRFEDKLVLLDFKTGDPSSSDRHQVEKYKEAIGHIESLPVEAYIVYLQPFHIVIV
ncbi:MAG: UvrD-helicase domain-containing protein [Bacteroidales bacterium]|nr:UvrD-helicase domain-containing protein [Bacteroidales bacterium]